MAARQIQDGPELIGIIVSRDLYCGDDMGYCLVIRPDAIIGARKPDSLTDFQVYLGPGSTVTNAVLVKANQIAEQLTESKEFSVPMNSIAQILLKRPGMFFGGYVIIKTRLKSVRIDMRLLSVGGLDLLEASNIMADSLRLAVGGRLHIVGTRLPVTAGWSWTRPNYHYTEDQSCSELAREEHLRNILTLLEKHQEGLSNAEIDTALSTYSQWTTIRHLRALMTMGLIEYKPELFGNPGRYLITTSGVSALKKVQPNSNLNHTTVR